jgi:hypothetical protein
VKPEICNLGLLMLATMLILEPAQAEPSKQEAAYVADFMFDLQASWRAADPSISEQMGVAVLEGQIFLRSETRDTENGLDWIICAAGRYDKLAKLSEPNQMRFEVNYAVAGVVEDETSIVEFGSTEILIERTNPEHDAEVLMVHLGEADPVRYEYVADLDLLTFAATVGECTRMIDFVMPETEEQRVQREKQSRMDHYRMILEADLLRGSD